MTIKEILEQNKGEYVGVEYYKETSRHHGFHTDYIEPIDEDEVDIDAEYENVEYELMSEEDYNTSIYANCGEYADFEDWFNASHGDKMLAIKITE